MADVEISKDDNEEQQETNTMNESGPQVDYIKKLLNHYKEDPLRLGRYLKVYLFSNFIIGDFR